MNKKITVLLVDDEESARSALRLLLARRPGIEVVGEAANLTEAVRLASTHRPDLILLDIVVGRESGFDLLRRLDYAPQIIFVSAHPLHAVRAFEINAVDFLVKPATLERFDAALARVRGRAAEMAPLPLRAGGTVVQREAGRFHVIPVEQIAVVVSEGNFSRVYLRDGESLFLRRLIGEWEAMLPAPPFVRVDRSTIFSLTLVREVAISSRDLTRVGVEGTERKFELGRAGSSRLRAALRGLERP